MELIRCSACRISALSLRRSNAFQRRRCFLDRTDGDVYGAHGGLVRGRGGHGKARCRARCDAAAYGSPKYMLLPSALYGEHGKHRRCDKRDYKKCGK